MFPSSDLTSATKSLSVATSDFSFVGTYTLQLKVYYTSFSSTVDTHEFLVVVEDYCHPSSVTVSQFSSSSLSYALGQSEVNDSFAAWTTVPAECALTYTLTITPAMIDPSLIVFDDTTLTLKLYGVDVFYGGDHTTGTYTPGTYSVEIKS